MHGSGSPIPIRKSDAEIVARAAKALELAKNAFAAANMPISIHHNEKDETGRIAIALLAVKLYGYIY